MGLLGRGPIINLVEIKQISRPDVRIARDRRYATRKKKEQEEKNVRSVGRSVASFKNNIIDKRVHCLPRT